MGHPQDVDLFVTFFVSDFSVNRAMSGMMTIDFDFLCHPNICRTVPSMCVCVREFIRLDRCNRRLERALGELGASVRRVICVQTFGRATSCLNCLHARKARSNLTAEQARMSAPLPLPSAIFGEGPMKAMTGLAPCNSAGATKLM